MPDGRVSQFALLHEIFILDAHLIKPLNVDRQQELTSGFIAEFLQTLGLVPLGELGIFEAVDDRAPGWSFIQPITTSHISGHYFEKPGRQPHIRIDAYSCDTVDWEQLVGVCDRHFNLSDWRANFIEREIEAAKSRRILDIAGFGHEVRYREAMATQVSAMTPGLVHSAEEVAQHATL